MFPIRDHNPSDNFPVINLLLIIVTSAVFYLQLISPSMEEFVYRFALIPSEVNPSVPSTLLPFLYSMFLHGGWLHIISNMWFLWIFGDNIESYLGHVKYLVFYLFCGLAAGVVQYLFLVDSGIPTLGASGAVAGILGAYLLLYPRHKIDTLVFSFFGFLHQVRLPAGLILGYWFVIQLFSGFGSLGLTGSGGIAWWAHIGGFATGYLFVKPFHLGSRQKREELL